MTDESRSLADQWPALVTFVGIVAMGVFIVTATDTDPLVGWVAIGFGAVAIGWSLVKAAVHALRGRG